MKLVVAVAVALSALGCSEKVLVRTDPPGASLRVGEQDLGALPPAGQEIEVPTGMGGVPVELKVGEQAFSTQLPRDRLNWWLVAAGVGGVVCCVPSLAAAGLCLANPALLPAALGCALGGGNVFICCGALAQPSWCTLPFGAAGALLGATPAAALLFAGKPAPEVVFKQPPPRAGAGDMAW